MDISKDSNLQNKIERIAQAIYLVSNHLKDTEPLKWELRKESVGFLTCIRSLGETGEGRDVPPDLVIDTLSLYARDLTSYVSLAIISGLISRNNGNLVIDEITLLLSTFTQVVNENTAKAGFVLSREFFATDPELADRLTKRIDKGHKLVALSDTRKVTKEPIESIKDKKNTRQERIISLLKAQPNLTIKDFVKVINDCSEKTIQRELGSLVKSGVVKKEGERRWSTYSLR